MTEALWFRKELEKTGAAAFGLIVCAFGSYLQLQAGIGLSPWNALNQGAAAHFGVTYGTAAAVISGLVILFDLALGEGIGIGSVLDTLLVGRFVDLFAKWELAARPAALPAQTALLLMGLTCSAAGVKIYMGAGLCCGPRDTLMVALAKRFRRAPIGAVNCLMFTLVMLTAIGMGCVIGVGTLISTFANGPILQLVFWMTGFDPCLVEHENLMQMARHYKALRARRLPKEDK